MCIPCDWQDRERVWRVVTGGQIEGYSVTVWRWVPTGSDRSKNYLGSVSPAANCCNDYVSDGNLTLYGPVVTICTTSNTLCTYWQHRLHWSLRCTMELVLLDWEVIAAGSTCHRERGVLGSWRSEKGCKVAIVVVLWGQSITHCGNKWKCKWCALTVRCVMSERICRYLIICTGNLWSNSVYVSDYEIYLTISELIIIVAYVTDIINQLIS